MGDDGDQEWMVTAAMETGVVTSIRGGEANSCPD